MNQDSDKEIDLLLRRHTRHSASGLPSAKGARADSSSGREGAAHMDADELSAYAEGALPEAARSRYMSHLADCDSCRRIVTELLLSSSAETVEVGTVAQTVEAPARNWREWLAAIFSPPVLRYAAPALALIAFASIVFIVIRNREVPSLVTQNQPNREQAANSGAVERQDETASSTGTSERPSDNHGAAPSASANSSAANSNTRAAQSQQSEQTVTTETTNTATTGQSYGLSSADSSKAADQPVAAPPPSPSVQENAVEAKKPTPPFLINPPNDKLADRAKEKDDASLAAQNRRESGEAAAPGAASGAGRRSSRSTEPGNSGALGAASKASKDERQQKAEAGKNAPATTARARRDASGADEESAAGTRTVAGKRFRQQNGVWVDTSYNSSRSVVRVRRGSEQYRALVADEPLIGTVSNSLGGSLIVVIKGKAYHIY